MGWLNKLFSGENEQTDETAKQQQKQKKNSHIYNPYVRFAAETTGRTYDEMQDMMEEAHSKYGIKYIDYVSFKCYNFKSEEEFTDLKTRKGKRRTYVMRKLREATGWSKEYSTAETKRIYRKFGLTSREYYYSGMYLLSDDEIEKKLNEKKKREEEIRRKVIEQSGWTEKRVRREMIYAELKYGIDPTDFMLLKPWRFSDEEMDKLSCVRTTAKLTMKYNTPEGRKLLDNKLEFDRVFADCIQRKYWTNDEEADYDSFCSFWDGLDEAISKPIALRQARGIHKIKVPQDMQAAFEEYQKSPQVLLEEVVRQHHDIDAIYPGSVNTLRMVTLLKDGEFHVLAAFMKFGKGGSIVDNMIAGGILAGVDEVKGVIETGAIDRDGNMYDHHPDTGKQIKGFTIPNYDKALELTEKALRKVPEINYVGWDVAVCQDKAVIIEGNALPGLMSYQLPYVQPPLNEPKKYKFEPYL